MSVTSTASTHRTTNGKTSRFKPTLWVDQYGSHYYAATVKELRKQIGNGGSRVSKMYVDLKSGGARHIGYVIGRQWLTGYIRMSNQA